MPGYRIDYIEAQLAIWAAVLEKAARRFDGTGGVEETTHKRHIEDLRTRLEELQEAHRNLSVSAYRDWHESRKVFAYRWNGLAVALDDLPRWISQDDGFRKDDFESSDGSEDRDGNNHVIGDVIGNGIVTENGSENQESATDLGSRPPPPGDP